MSVLKWYHGLLRFIRGILFCTHKGCAMAKRLYMTNKDKIAIKAVIFDYDGLLVDTEDIWFEACKHVCIEYNVDINENHRLELMRSGLSEYMVNRFSLPVPKETVRPK